MEDPPTAPGGLRIGAERTSAAESLKDGPTAAEESTIPRVEEVMTVAKREVATGQVRVRTVTETFEQLAHADLLKEIAEIDRVAVEKFVEAAPAIRTEGDVTIIPVVEEVLVVEKRLLLKEELHIRRRTEKETVESPVTLRKQRAIIERSGSE